MPYHICIPRNEDGRDVVVGDNRGNHEQMTWGRKVLRGEIVPRRVQGVDITRHGHTPVTDVRKIGNRNFVDAGADMGKRVTVRNIAELVSEYQDFAALA